MEDTNIQSLLPKFVGLVDPKMEREITASLTRIYNYFNDKLEIQKQDYNGKLETSINAIRASQKDITGLINVFSTPAPGGATDPLLVSLTQQFGAQSANAVFAGPTPSFRLLLVADIPNLPSSKITSGTFLLAQLDAKILKTDNALTVDITGAPNANIGFVIMKDNAGNQVKVMVCA